MEDAKEVRHLSRREAQWGMEEARNEARDGMQSNMVDVQYTSLVGSLQYLAVCTRLDLAMTLSALSRFRQNSTKALGGRFGMSRVEGGTGI